MEDINKQTQNTTIDTIASSIINNNDDFDDNLYIPS